MSSSSHLFNWIVASAAAAGPAAARAPDARWSFVWGEEPWQQAHGEPPGDEADLDGGVWKLRVADDSGNAAVVDL